MIVDCFMFFNELDLLEIRLNSLAPYVERFVLCECPVTHSGKSKSLYFEENKNRFKDFNITHLIMDGYRKYISDNPWEMEKYQRNFLMNGLMTNISPEDLVMISDLDEIPNMGIYKYNIEGVFIQKVYYYALNIYSRRSNWKGTVIVHRKNISTINNIRFSRSSFHHIQEFGGWHFSTLGPEQNIITKIEAFAHQEFNNHEIKNGIKNNMNNLIDPYNRGKLKVEMPSGPKWLLDNKNKYKHLFYGGEGNGGSE